MKAPRWRNGLIVLASVLVIGGIGLSRVWTSIRPPLVGVDGRLVETRVLGDGTPTVVFELGAAGGHLAYLAPDHGRARKSLLSCMRYC